AISALNSAVQKDPNFALGYAALGEAYRLKYQTEHHPEWLDAAAVNSQRAVEIDDRLVGPHVTFGPLNTTLSKNDITLQDFQKALNLKPRAPEAIMGMAGLYERMGHLADAEANFKRAIALRPDYWGGYVSLGNFYHRQKRIRDAITQYQHVIEFTPDNSVAYSNLGAAYHL